MADAPYRGQDIRSVVLQPTTLCNLNCSYCYLPQRAAKQVMPIAVARAVADSLVDISHRVLVLWHGGEPLAAGAAHFRRLLEEFEPLRTSGQVQHSLQTNATLLDDEWCDLLKQYDFKVGVSIDGPPRLNSRRKNWAGTATDDAAMRGIEALRRNRVNFGVIAVVSVANVSSAEALYEFFVDLGGDLLCINVEEREGLNRKAEALDEVAVRNFWRSLFCAWRAKPKIKIREFDDALGWLQALAGGARRPPISDMWPTISVKGDVVVLAPELMAATTAEQQTFIVGNVLYRNLCDIVDEAKRIANYVTDFWTGNAECRRRCEYYSFCGGGHASNKYFETGSTNATRTEHCFNSRIAVLDAVLEEL